MFCGKWCQPKPDGVAEQPEKVERVFGNSCSDWRMICWDSPLFQEWLKLVEEAGCGTCVDTDDIKVCSTDALVVVDYQMDFVPCDDLNPDGGSFGVAEGAKCSPLIVQLMKTFAAAGGGVYCTREYHPADHCSFLPSGGPFPPHCVCGTPGEKFYPTVKETLEELRDAGSRCEVVFKGHHKDIDSFGSIMYPDAQAAYERLSHREDRSALQGRELYEWTGSVALKCSNDDKDVDAPPDIMSIYNAERLEHMLAKSGCKRLFVCGLALDYCVLDTALNATGFDKVCIIADAARAAHIPDFGQFGSGFLTDPCEFKAKIAARGVRLCPSLALMPSYRDAEVQAPVAASVPFPGKLSSFALAEAEGLRLKVDFDKLTFVADGAEKEISTLKAHGGKPEGHVSPAGPVTVQGAQRQALGIPESAKKVVWVQPADAGAFPNRSWGYLASTSPSAALFVLGGFAYLSDTSEVVSVKAMCYGSGLDWDAPQAWPGPSCSKTLGKDRWHAVTWMAPRRAGAKLIAWIGPGEVVSGADGKKVEVKDGAFAFLFHEDLDSHDDRDVVFHVKGLSTFRRASSQVMGKLSSKA